MKISRFTKFKKCNSFIDTKHVVNNSFTLKEFLFQISYESKFKNGKEKLVKVIAKNKNDGKELVTEHVKEMNTSKYKMKKSKVYLLNSTERIVCYDFCK